jgi:outer membrane immunogenic protein
LGCDQNITAFGVKRGYGVTERGIINRGLTMKKFLIATAALASVALVGPANAADLPVKAAPILMPALYNWSGLYIGVEAGGVMGQRTEWILPETSTDDPAALDVGHPLHGGFVGGEAGINWQVDRWVFGIEGDWNWSELEEALTCQNDDDNNVSLTCGSRIRSFATVRGRIGYAFGPRGDFLAYLTAGGAWASQSARIGQLVVPGLTAETWRDTWGWTVGGGAEYGITPWLSVKGEVLYVDLAGRDFSGAALCAVAFECDENPHVRHSFVLARMGLNWRFNWGKGKGPVAVVARY